MIKLLLLTLAIGLLSASPPHLSKTKRRKPGGNVTVLIYNNSTSASVYYDVKWYDNTSGTIYQEETFTLAPTNYYQPPTVDMTDANPYISIKYTTTPSQQMAFLVTYPDGGGGCHMSNFGTGTATYSVNTGGFGTYELDYNQGPGCN
ncbi:hypothetical protein [Dinghuibacter silviterrae]|uniref:Ig-like domain-containing protein n=1 Tax=Dinghuibacter silviterrae TaxID=1539049 RepID=A0A4R8DV53_9BACT|nr:hypothetical protein [Dinghuibacter silviterrae]TDX01876.1 hypothetical protein EDB95_2920 [Dinghuibacter silviterrae]